MKKILLSVLVMWAAGAYCQEIRMPDDKRKDYLKEEQKATTSTTLEQNENTDQSREGRREQALQARQRAAGAASNAPQPGQMVYCIIKEIAAPNANKTKVIIEVDSEFGNRMKGLDKKSQIALGLATEKRMYKNALGALNNFSMHGWTLTHVSDYMDTNTEMMVHDYLVGYRIP